MTDIAIRVENLSKEYHLGRAQAQHDTLRDALVASVRRLGRRPSRRDSDDDILWALKDVSFEVQRGEVVGIIGRNGAGKSTLLKILSQITVPTRGRAELHGRVGSLLEVGTGFHPELTGRENIYLNGAILGMRRQEIARRFDEIVAFAEIERFLDTPVKRYSSGMYVRLAFAVAAHLEPEILLVDEVLAVGDAAFQKKCLGKMGEVATQGRTVLFVSHQLSMIQTLCETAILLREGHLYHQGPSSDVISNYLKFSAASDQVRSSVSFPDKPQQKAQLVSAQIWTQVERHGLQFDVFDPITLDVQYLVRQPIEGVAVNLVVRRNGDILFVSFDTDDKPDLLDSRVPGSYITSVQLPTPLKSGHYTVDLSLGMPNVGGVDVQRDALAFDIEEFSFDTSMRSYSSNRPGVMATHLKWNTTLVDKTASVQNPRISRQYGNA